MSQLETRKVGDANVLKRLTWVLPALASCASVVGSPESTTSMSRPLAFYLVVPNTKRVERYGSK